MSDKRNLFNKVWDQHAVRTLPNGQTQLFIGLHLIHEVTSPQAFEILRERNLKVAYPQAHVRYGRPYRANCRPVSTISGWSGRTDDVCHRTELRRIWCDTAGPERWSPGNCSRRRAGTGTDSAWHDNRLW